jgi:hypothetical protein
MGETALQCFRLILKIDATKLFLDLAVEAIHVLEIFFWFQIQCGKPETALALLWPETDAYLYHVVAVKIVSSFMLLSHISSFRNADCDSPVDEN